MLPTLDEPPKEPVLVPHSVADRLLTPTAQNLRIPGYKTFFRLYQMKRTTFLTMLVWNIFYLYVQPVPFSLCAGLLLILFSQKESNGEEILPREHMQSIQSKLADAAARRRLKFRCAVCGRENSDLGAGQKLQACSKCRPLGRKVYYCSK